MRRTHSSISPCQIVSRGFFATILPRCKRLLVVVADQSCLLGDGSCKGFSDATSPRPLPLRAWNQVASAEIVVSLFESSPEMRTSEVSTSLVFELQAPIRRRGGRPLWATTTRQKTPSLLIDSTIIRIIPYRYFAWSSKVTVATCTVIELATVCNWLGFPTLTVEFDYDTVLYTVSIPVTSRCHFERSRPSERMPQRQQRGPRGMIDWMYLSSSAAGQ